MNKFVALILLAVMVCATASAVYPGAHYYKSHHLGGAYYAHRPVKYVYRKPVLHHPAPIVYAHKSHSKPRTIHYVKPVVHHEVPHHAPVYHSKPVYYLGGHAGHGIAHKPAVYGHGIAYKPSAYGHGISYLHKGH